MLVTFALALFFVWYVGAEIYDVGGGLLYLLLLLALMSVACHVVNGCRSRIAWNRLPLP